MLLLKLSEFCGFAATDLFDLNKIYVLSCLRCAVAFS